MWVGTVDRSICAGCRLESKILRGTHRYLFTYGHLVFIAVSSSGPHRHRHQHQHIGQAVYTSPAHWLAFRAEAYLLYLYERGNINMGKYALTTRFLIHWSWSYWMVPPRSSGRSAVSKYFTRRDLDRIMVCNNNKNSDKVRILIETIVSAAKLTDTILSLILLLVKWIMI